MDRVKQDSMPRERGNACGSGMRLPFRQNRMESALVSADAGSTEMNLDESYDVVVIGSGIGGVATALAARESGLRPVLLEKAAKLGGGTSFSMGGIWIGCNHLMLAAGYRDTREDVLSYMRFVAAEEADEERLLAYADRGAEALKFFEDCGIRFRISRGLTD